MLNRKKRCIPSNNNKKTNKPGLVEFNIQLTTTTNP